MRFYNLSDVWKRLEATVGYGTGSIGRFFRIILHLGNTMTHSVPSADSSIHKFQSLLGRRHWFYYSNYTEIYPCWDMEEEYLRMNQHFESRITRHSSVQYHVFKNSSRCSGAICFSTNSKRSNGRF